MIKFIFWTNNAWSDHIHTHHIILSHRTSFLWQWERTWLQSKRKFLSNLWKWIEIQLSSVIWGVRFYQNNWKHAKSVICKMSHLFILKLGVLWIYSLGYFVQYVSPAEDCEWSSWTELDKDQIQHRARDCEGKVEIESRNCNLISCTISNG